MNSYTLTKTAEEAGEVVQATMKLMLHKDAKSLDAFVGELADLQTFIRICVARLPAMQQARFVQHTKRRMKREQKKGKING